MKLYTPLSADQKQFIQDSYHSGEPSLSIQKLAKALGITTRRVRDYLVEQNLPYRQVKFGEGKKLDFGAMFNPRHNGYWLIG